MKKTMLLGALGGLLSVMPAHASIELIQNGGFETGSFSPWTTTKGNAAVVTGDAHSGTYAAQIIGNSSIGETVNIVAGQSYVLDFWAKDSGDGKIEIKLDGITAPKIVEAQLSSSYQKFELLIGPVTASGALNIHWITGGNGDPTSVFVDDVSLTAACTPVPEPATLLSGALLLLPLGVSAMRLKRKKN